MKIKGVGFDIDGTLYNNMFMYFCSLPSFAAHPSLVLHYSRVRKEIRKVRPVGDFKVKQAEMVAESMGISFERAAEMIERHLYRSWAQSFRAIRPLPGLAEGIRELRRKGYRLGVLSDFPVQNKLEYLGLEGLWDCAFTAEDTGYLKPAGEPFAELALRMGLAPDEILYVGNSYSKDIVGAKQAGMSAAHYSRSCRKGSIADFTFGKYSELFDYIASLEKC